MIKRSKEEWFAHFEAHALSGQSMQAYCKSHGLCNRHFSQRRKQLGWEVKESIVRTATGVSHKRFVPVQLNQEVEVAAVSDVIQLQHGNLRLTFPASIKASWLATVVKSLT